MYFKCLDDLINFRRKEEPNLTTMNHLRIGNPSLFCFCRVLCIGNPLFSPPVLASSRSYCFRTGTQQGKQAVLVVLPQ